MTPQKNKAATFDITETSDPNQVVGLKKIILNAIPYGVKRENIIVALSTLTIRFAELIRQAEDEEQAE